jgi:hypothetical protein
MPLGRPPPKPSEDPGGGRKYLMRENRGTGLPEVRALRRAWRILVTRCWSWTRGRAPLRGGRVLPRYARGLAFIDRNAIIGLSLARDNRTFQGLPLDRALAAHGAAPRCGLIVVDIKTGDTTEWVRIEGVVRELYDVAVLPGIRNPSVIGFISDEIRRIISIDEG